MIKKILHFFGVDYAIIYGSMSRIWSIFTGPITLLLIAAKFSRELQGYYYTFNSLMALTVFLELGIGVVIQQFTSHEWALLKINEKGYITGDEVAFSRLRNISQLAFRWYGISGIMACIALSIGGFFFFSQRPEPYSMWLYPWIMLCLFSSINLSCLPLWTLLDGSEQMRFTNRARLMAGVAASVSLWVALLLNAGLWVASISLAANVVTGITLLLGRYKNYFISLLRPITIGKVNWRYEIWPMQWKIALSWLSGYFIFSLFTPVMFHYQGPVLAGQMGMTLTLINALQSFAYTWISTKTPTFGVHIARREYENLDSLYRRSTFQALVVGTLGALAIICVLEFLRFNFYKFSIRFLPIFPTVLFLISTIVSIYVGSLAAYLRAHKQEPFLWPSVIGGILTGSSTIILGNHFGATGAASGYLFLNVLFIVPELIIFERCRSAWHTSTENNLL